MFPDWVVCGIAGIVSSFLLLCVVKATRDALKGREPAVLTPTKKIVLRAQRWMIAIGLFLFLGIGTVSLLSNSADPVLPSGILLLPLCATFGLVGLSAIIFRVWPARWRPYRKGNAGLFYGCIAIIFSFIIGFPWWITLLRALVSLAGRPR